MSTRTVDNPKVVSRDEWLAARKKLLVKEKQLTRERDAIAAERRQLPWVKVEKNYVFDSPSGKLSPTSSTAEASLSCITSCSVRSGKKAAPAAPSTWITRTARWCTWRSATCPLRQFPERHCPRLGRSRNEWVGRSAGCRPMGRISTTTTKHRSRRSKLPKARSNTTSISWSFPVRKRLESASSIRTKMATSSTRIPRTLAGPRTRSTRTTISTLLPKAVMKMGCPSRCHGSAIMIAMRTDA